MKSFFRIISFLLLTVTVLLLAVSCWRPNSIGDTGYYDAHFIISNSVPFFGYPEQFDTFQYAKLLDEDEYGRRIYEYFFATEGRTAYDTKKPHSSILVVCQFVEGDRRKSFTAGWYDKCWIAKSGAGKMFGLFADDEINGLKELNDWGKPLDKSKMNIGKRIVSIASLNEDEQKECWAERAQMENEGNEIRLAVIRDIVGFSSYSTFIYKNGYAYGVSFSKIEGENYYFYCYDRSEKKIVKIKKYEGELFACRDDFLAFIAEGIF